MKIGLDDAAADDDILISDNNNPYYPIWLKQILERNWVTSLTKMRTKHYFYFKLDMNNYICPYIWLSGKIEFLSSGELFDGTYGLDFNFLHPCSVLWYEVCKLNNETDFYVPKILFFSNITIATFKIVPLGSYT